MINPSNRNGFLRLALAFALSLHGLASSGFALAPTFDPPVQTGTIQSSSLIEISGIAASRTNSGVLWVHNDSGDSARVFAITSAGALLGTYTLQGATNTDWEDIAVGPGPDPGRHYVYVADTGNNNLDRGVLTIYRVPEPPVTNTAESPVTATIASSSVEAFPVQYPNGARYDCETLLVDPIYGDILLVTRDRSLTGTSYVFLYSKAAQTPGVTATLQLAATIQGAGEIKGGDVSPAGELVILRPHSNSVQLPALLWERNTGSPTDPAFPAESISNVFRAGNPVYNAPLANEQQGEAVGFAADGSGYFTVSEGTSQPLYWCARQTAPTTVPAAPSGLVAKAGNAQVALSWSASATAASYTIKRSIAGAPYAMIGTVAGATSFTDTTAQNGVPAYYVVSASNEIGEGADSQPVLTAAGLPSAPSGLAAAVLSKSEIRLTWIENAINEDGLYIEQSTDGRRFRQIGSVGPNTTEILISGLSGGKTYYYRLRAFNGAGTSAYSNTASAKTPR